jgi:HPt (histidine-containing phosphotransfer) domain-containing protein
MLEQPGIDGGAVFALESPMTAVARTLSVTSEGKPPVDLAHLGRYTLGNRALEKEVLDMFCEQASASTVNLRAARDAKAWKIAAHTVKGSARAVGAWTVAELAQQAESLGFYAPELERWQIIGAIESALADATAHIQALYHAA